MVYSLIDDAKNSRNFPNAGNFPGHTFFTASIADIDDQRYSGTYIFPGPIIFPYCLNLNMPANQIIADIKNRSAREIADILANDLDFGLFDIFMTPLEIDGETDLDLSCIALSGANRLEADRKLSSSHLFDMEVTHDFRKILNKCASWAGYR